MGEARKKLSATERFLASHPACCLCGGGQKAETREHLPPIAIFDRTFRPSRELVVPACKCCNSGTSTADLVTAIVARWSFGDRPSIELEDHKKLVNRLRKQAPNVLDEWTSIRGSQKKRGRRLLLERGVPISEYHGLIRIGSETVPLLNLFAHKLTLGLFYWEAKHCLSATGLVKAYVKLKEELARIPFPQELLEPLGPTNTLSQGAWDARGQFQYRAAYNPTEGVFAHATRLRTGMIIYGLAIEKPELLGEAYKEDMLQPPNLLNAVTREGFRNRL